ncbi:AAA family ATPase [Halocalculus aciditolerans]|uniref:DNA helicase n=1 Tax=Halocalculus aciditolerans TaxID=1383812 RepID=A0A830FI42_9EURY|nr:minichromosome maintenance protein MCM [Halocalculus aciditolerans]GGL54990.1 ATPase AAA [Halocalculus aciditolerans]
MTGPNPDSELVEKFEEFFRRYYSDDVGELARLYPKEQKSLIVEFGDIYKFDTDVADDWLTHPSTVRDAAEEALRLYDLPIDISLGSAHVRLTDTRGAMERESIGDLGAESIGDYVAVRGQLEKVTDKLYRVVEAVFVCQRCGHETTVPQEHGEFQEPYQCASCERQGPFKLDPERSELVNLRKLKVTELPEERSNAQGEDIAVFVEDDLADWGSRENGLPDRAGEEIVALGQYVLDESGTNDNGEFDGWLLGGALHFPEDAARDIDVEEYREEFEAVAAADDTIEQLRDSIAPQLDLDEDVEAAFEGAVAWLFDSYRIEQDGGSFRGNIHMGWIGDPGKGKSTAASRLSHLSPKCEYRSGGSLKKVGLTSAAVQEEFAGKTEWTLQPGILPRANEGHCIIDEVDAVMDAETKSLHDALEGEQMLKVDKAGIKANLPTRTALLALGNPTHGRFDRYEPVAEQVDLDDALIDRMDLLFALTDVVNEERDRSKASHIIGSYRELSEEEVYERGARSEAPRDRETVDQPVADDVFKAMILYARENVFPVLSDEAAEMLEDFYVDVRDLNGGHAEDDDAAIPATPRKLEAGIRIATAFARACLSDTVEPEHAERAIRVSKRVIGLNYDPETGEFDAGRTDEGEPKSQQERRKRIKALIDDLDDAGSGGGAKMEDVLDAAQSEGIGRSQAEHDIDKLGGQGEVMFPAHGEVRTT